MAYLNKDQYAYRRESAARRNADNEVVAVEHGMTEEQAELISDLCRLRHELHTNMDRVTRSDTDLRIKAQLVAANAAIKESGLTPVPCIPTDEGDYIDIDDIDLLQEIEDWPESCTDEWQEKWNEEYSRIYDELEQLNSGIEHYLADIDRQYGTAWCPSGALRI